MKNFKNLFANSTIRTLTCLALSYFQFQEAFLLFGSIVLCVGTAALGGGFSSAAYLPLALKAVVIIILASKAKKWIKRQA